MDESELDTYFHECIEKDSHDFNIIDWWKLHSPRFPILHRALLRREQEEIIENNPPPPQPQELSPPPNQ